MRICYFGTYEKEYPRNAIVIEGLRRAGIEVLECHESVWEERRDKSDVYRGLGALQMLVRLFLAYVRLVFRYFRLPTHDVIIVGYVGHFDVPIAWLLSRLRAAQLVFNPLVSLYDTFCGDRGLVKPQSFKGRLFWLLDHGACRVADLVLMDTFQHQDYFVDTFGLPRNKFRVLPVGADDRLFKTVLVRETKPAHLLEVLFVGKLIPLHGIETILRAAHRLREEAYHFTVVGSGQEEERVQQLIEELDLTNVRWVEWVAYSQLPSYYAQSDICLGIFGSSDKTSRVIPNKVFQALAVGCPVITADSPAIRSQLHPGEDVWVCQPEDPEDLSSQIRYLGEHSTIRKEIGTKAGMSFSRFFGLSIIGQRLKSILGELIPGLTQDDQMDWGKQPEFYGPRHRFRESYLLDAVRDHAPGSSVIDVACGAGSLLRRLTEEGYLVVGLDLSMNFLKYVKSNNGEVMQGNVISLPISDQVMDAATAGEILEHINEGEVELTLREIWRVLRPGGVLALSVPAGPDLWDWHDDWSGHLRRYTRTQLQSILEEIGFKIIKIHRFGYPLVRLFHRHIYLRRYRKSILAHRGDLEEIAVTQWWEQAVANLLYFIFHVDNLFNALPLGIGLIAIVRKPPPDEIGKEM